MAEFSRLIITNKGQELIAKIISGVGNVEFTKISSSSTAYTEAQLQDLTVLPDVRQTSLVSKVIRTNKVAVKVEAAFTNTELADGYYMRSLGLYALDPDDGEILYAVTAETSGNCYMPAYNGVTVSGAYVQLITTIGNSENVSLEVNQAAVATIADIKELQTKIEECFTSVSDGKKLVSAAITDKGIVTSADATFGEMAENISQIQTDPLLQEKTAALLTSKQIITADKEYDGLSQVTIPAITGTAKTSDVLDGKTFNSSAGIEQTGDMADRQAITVDAAAVTQDGNYTYMTLPNTKACYNGGSKVRALNSDLKQKYQVFVVANGTNMKNLLPDDYQKLTIDNFFVVPPANFSGSASGSSSNVTWLTVSASFNRGTYTYNASTGIFNIGNPSISASGGDSYNTCASTSKNGSYPKAICVYPAPAV